MRLLPHGRPRLGGGFRGALRLVLLVAVLLGLASCGPGGTDGEDASDGGQGVVGGRGDVPGAGEDDGGGGEGTDDDGGDRQVITTASLTVVVGEVLDAADEAVRITESAGGRVDERTERPGLDDEAPSAHLTLRVPADRVSDVLDDLQGLGEPRDLTVSREDVTLTVTDLDARIRALEVSIGRLQELMGSATSTADLLEAERALTERQSELDSLRAQRTYLGEQVALGTISLSLLSREAAPSPEPGGFWGGVVRGWTALVTTLNTAIEVLGALVPWALFAALVAGLVLLVVRIRRGRTASAVPPATRSEGPPTTPSEASREAGTVPPDGS
jgi:hypothetical protein